jgi:hypothetical protein
LERRTLADRQIIATYLAAGAENLELPDVDAAVAEFDRVLAAEPLPESPKLTLLREWGVA